MRNAVLAPNSMGVSQSLIRAKDSNAWEDNDYLWKGVYHLKFDAFRLPVLACSHCETEDSGEEDRDLWRNRLSRALCEAIEGRQITAFEENDVTTYAKGVNDSSRWEESTIELDEEFYSRLKAEAELDARARVSFQRVIDRLRARVDTIYRGAIGDFLSDLHFVEEVLDSGYLGHLYGWYREKLSGIRMYVNDLARRKNANHPSYLSGIGYIRDNLFSFAPPMAWLRQPPVMPFRDAIEA